MGFVRKECLQIGFGGLGFEIQHVLLRNVFFSG